MAGIFSSVVLSIHLGLHGRSIGIGLLLRGVELRLGGRRAGFDVGLVGLGLDVRLLFRLLGGGLHGLFLMLDRVFGGFVLGINRLFLLVAAQGENAGGCEDGEYDVFHNGRGSVSHSSEERCADGWN